MIEQKAEWHLLRGREQTGPYPLSKAIEAVQHGILTKTDYVWRHGWPDWRQVGSVPELVSEAAASPPAPAVPTPAEVAVDPADAATVEALHRATAEPLGDEKEKPAGNYFVRHWRGDLPLPVAFWVNGVILTLAFRLVVTPLAAVLIAFAAPSDAANAAVIFTGLMTAIGFGLLIWQCVGIWRSASKHTERGGHGAWGVLAKLAVVLAILATVTGAIMLTYVALER